MVSLTPAPIVHDLTSGLEGHPHGKGVAEEDDVPPPLFSLKYATTNQNMNRAGTSRYQTIFMICSVIPDGAGAP